MAPLAPSPTPDSHRRMWRLAQVLIPALAVGVFLPTARYDFTGFDDTAYVVNNDDLHDGAGLWRMWTTSASEQYYPVTFTSYWVEYQLWGPHPAGYHATNVVLHGLNVWLVMRVLAALGCSPAVAVLTAVWFAIHPVQVMSVAWIAQRKNLLSATFALLAMLGWCRWRRTGHPAAYGMAIATVTLALLAKTSALAVVVTLAIVDRLIHRRSWRASAAAQVPMVVVGVAAVALAWWFERTFLVNPPPLADRPFIAARALWWYLWRCLWPSDLLPLYPRWSVDPETPWTWVPLLALGAGGLLIWRRRQGPLSAGAAHFVAWLLPTLGLVAYGNLALSYVSDHYLYVAALAPWLGVAALVAASCRRWPRGGWACAVCVTMALGAVTLRDAPVWRDARSLWTHTLTGHPRCFAAHAGLAQQAALAAEWDAALDHLRAAAEIEPAEYGPHEFVGLALARAGHLDTAAMVFERFSAAQPHHAVAWLHLGAIERSRRRLDAARSALEQALGLDPTLTDAHLELAQLALGLLDRPAAARHFRAITEQRPQDALGYLGLATAQRGLGDGAGACATLRTGLARCGDDVRLLNYLARVLATSPQDAVRDGRSAEAHARRALALVDPPTPELLETLAATLADQARFAEAIATLDEALRNAPPQLAARLQGQRAAYERGEPLREAP